MQPHTECVRRYSVDSACRNGLIRPCGRTGRHWFRHPSDRAPKRGRGEREQGHRELETKTRPRRQAEGPGREGAEEATRPKPVLGRSGRKLAQKPRTRGVIAMIRGARPAGGAIAPSSSV